MFAQARMRSADSSAAVDEPSHSQADRQSRLWTTNSVAALAVLTAVGTVLRFLFLVRKPFWFDECFSVEVARLRWSDFFQLLWRREANMSLYYLLLRGWLHFGSSEFFIRSLSVICSLASVWAIYWLAGMLFGRRVALLSAGLLSFNTYHIRYAQEARSYSLFVFLAILSSGFFVAMVREESRLSRIGYVATSVLAVYSHLYALLLLAAQWLSIRARKKTDGELLSPALRRAWIWIVVLSSPIVIFAAKTGAGPIRWIPKPKFHDVLEFAEHLAGNAGIVLLLIYVASCLVAVAAGWPRQEVELPDLSLSLSLQAWRLRFLLLWLLFPVVLLLLLSLGRPLFLGRYFIFCLPPFVILAAAGMAGMRKIRLLVIAAAILLSLEGTASYYNHDFDLVRDGSETATNYVLDHSEPGDAILFHIAEARVPYEYFKSIRASKNFVAGPDIVYPRHSDHLDYRDFSGRPSVELVKSLAAGYARVWVVLMSNTVAGHPDASTDMLNEVLEKSFIEAEEERLPGVEVRLYQRR
jgi:mannosyltransferase